MEKRHVLDKPCSDMNYDPVGHEFSLKESTTYIT